MRTLLIPSLLAFLVNAACAFDWEGMYLLERSTFEHVQVYCDSLVEVNDRSISFRFTTRTGRLGHSFSYVPEEYDVADVYPFQIGDGWFELIIEPERNRDLCKFLYRYHAGDTSFFPERMVELDIAYLNNLIDVQPIEGGDYLALYQTLWNDPSPYYAARFTSAGEVLWSERILAASPRDEQNDALEIRELKGFRPVTGDQGSFVCFGRRLIIREGISRVYLIKVNTDGEVVWNQELRFPGWGVPEFCAFSDSAYGLVGAFGNSIRYFRVSADGDSLDCRDFPTGGMSVSDDIFAEVIEGRRVLTLFEIRPEDLDGCLLKLLYFTEQGDSLDGYTFNPEMVDDRFYGPMLQRPDGEISIWTRAGAALGEAEEVLFTLYPDSCNLEVDHLIYEFALPGGEDTLEVVIRNTGRLNLTLFSVELSAPEGSPLHLLGEPIVDAVIAPGDSLSPRISFSPPRAGRYYAELRILSDDEELSDLTLYLEVSSLTASEVNAPIEFYLSPAWPNPFNSTTRLEYSIPQAGWVSMRLYDLSGRAVVDLVDGVDGAGRHSVILDGAGLAAGIYFIRLESAGRVDYRKVAVVK